MENIQIKKNNKVLEGTVKLPYSKSEANRALIIQSLSEEEIVLNNLSEAEDTVLLDKYLKMIDTCGKSGLPMIIDAGNAGTVMRFLTAYLSQNPGRWLLTGCKRMHERPVNMLVDALQKLGAEIEYKERDGYPPILITGKEFEGGEVSMDAGVSSQFISALLMIGPIMPKGLILNLKGDFISRPYVKMTIGIMEHFGIEIEYSSSQIKVKHQEYKGGNFAIQPDWSAASYWYEMVAFSEKAKVIIPELKQHSLQGDRVLPEIYDRLGVVSEFTDEGLVLTKGRIKIDYFEYDFKDCPDLAQAVLATCAGLGIEGTFLGLKSLRIKETDRIEKMNNELAILGFTIEEKESVWKLKNVGERKTDLSDHKVQTYGDHRMAMCMAPLAMITGELNIENPGVVVKSYPRYWEDLQKFGF